MLRLAPCLVLLAAGCAVGPRPNPVGIPSAVRGGVASAAWPALERALRADGFDPALVSTSGDTRAMASVGEDWDEQAAGLVFSTTRNGEAVVPSTADMASALRAVRAEIRRVVLATPDADYLDWTEGEGYRERTVSITYRVQKVFGSVRFRLAPATGKAEETASRLDVTIREQPVP